MLKSLIAIVDLSVFPFSCISFSFTYFVALLFDVYTFRIAMSSWWIDPLLLHNVSLFPW